MNILLATAELHPFSKTGGLADMVAALGKSLAAEGHEVGIMTPLYHGIRERFEKIEDLGYEVNVPMNGTMASGGIAVLKFKKNLTIYFVDQPAYYDRPALYGENNEEYPDNPERFIYFSKAVAHFARYYHWRPDVVHVHDWQAGLVPPMLRHADWDAPPCVMTIHNLAYPGHYSRERSFDLTNLPESAFQMHGVEFNGGLNFLKSGIVYSDAITTVSPRYAREICTEEYGCSLDGVLRDRVDRMTGILNGVDYEEWNTTKNIHLHHHYSVRSMRGKAMNKIELQHELGLPPNPDVPFFGTVTRLADQKGVDIIIGALEELLHRDIQFVLLGSGDPAIQAAYLDLQARFPDKVCSRIGFDLALSHRIEAGCDFFLMPSRFEPCGLNQMYSLRFGTIPIVRRTGGLDDSVIDIREDADNANGIKFNEFSVGALSKAMKKALALFEHKDLFQQMRKNAMNADFSWDRTCREYNEVYERVCA
ncbi:MAG: glycogen synthase GlgA [Limisphaerales bacterium]